MSFATKAVVVGLACLATISFAGAGVGAVMEDTATARATVGVGSASVTLGPATTGLGQLPALYWNAGQGGGDVPASAGAERRLTVSQGADLNSVTLGRLTNPGPEFTEIVPLTVTYVGGVGRPALDLTVAGVTGALAQHSTVFVCPGAGDATWLGSTFEPAAYRCQGPVALAAVESAPLIISPRVWAAGRGHHEALTVVVDRHARQDTPVSGSFVPKITVAIPGD